MWKDKVKGQSSASASSSVIDLTWPCNSVEGAPLEDQPSIASISTCSATTTATSPSPPIVNAFSLTTATPSSLSLSTFPTPTVLTGSVGVVPTAALALPPSSASVIEMLLSRLDGTLETNVEINLDKASSLATETSHANSPSSINSGSLEHGCSLNPMATNIEALLSQYAQSDISGGNSTPYCETSPSIVELVCSEHAIELSSPSVSSVDNDQEMGDEQSQCNQSSF